MDQGNQLLSLLNSLSKSNFQQQFLGLNPMSKLNRLKEQISQQPIYWEQNDEIRLSDLLASKLSEILVNKKFMICGGNMEKIDDFLQNPPEGKIAIGVYVISKQANYVIRDRFLNIKNEKLNNYIQRAHDPNDQIQTGFVIAEKEPLWINLRLFKIQQKNFKTHDKWLKELKEQVFIDYITATEQLICKKCKKKGRMYFITQQLLCKECIDQLLYQAKIAEIRMEKSKIKWNKFIIINEGNI